MKALLLTLAASTLLIAPAAFSQTHPSNEPHSRPNAPARHQASMIDRHVDRLAAIFNLSPDQKKETATYFSDAWNANKPVMMQMREDHKNLDKDIQAKADQSKLTADASAIGHDRGSIMANDAYAQEKFFSLLSPAEQAKYEKLQSTRFGSFSFGPGHAAPGAVTR